MVSLLEKTTGGGVGVVNMRSAKLTNNLPIVSPSKLKVQQLKFCPEPNTHMFVSCSYSVNLSMNQ